MDFEDAESYLKSPLFQKAMDSFKVGKWDDGFSKLSQVEKNYPMESSLRSLRQEMEIKARISEYETEENRVQRIHQFRKFSFRFFLLLAVLVAGYFAISIYSGWIQKQVAVAQSEFSRNMLLAELTVEFRNAQNLYAAGKSNEALAKFEYIKSKNPDFPGLNEAITQAQRLQEVEDQYTQAMNLLQVGDSGQALAILQEISQKMPNYRDVSLQVKNLQTQSEMDSVMLQADQAYNEGRFEDALSGYESLRLMDPTFKVSHIEDYLFQSYIKAAQSLLDAPIPSMETLRKIDDYFSKALALRPQDRDALAARTQVRLVIEDGMIGDYLSQVKSALANDPDSMDAQQTAMKYLGMALAVRPNDAEVLLEYQLAQAFIQAVNDFARASWDSVIENLEFVVREDPAYANGTATQTLYDTYIARGSDYIAAGDYSLALEDFQRSAVLAQQLPDSDILSFEAQTMIAEAQGLLSHFQEAVLIYQDALAKIGLRERIVALHNSMSDTLTYAEYLAGLDNYQNAFYAYRKLIQNRVLAYDQTTVVTIKSGDYVSMIARRYKTTVSAILSANNMNNQPRLEPNTQLIIPVLP